MKALLRIKLARIKEVASIMDAPAYYDDYISRGVIEGDFLIARPEAREAMRKKYPLRGAGDVVAHALRPAASVMSAVGITKCKCKKRQALLNRMLPLD